MSSVTDEDATREKADRGGEEDAAPDDGHGSGREAERPAAGDHAGETRTRKYARILQKDYLARKSPGDEAGIRRLLEKIEEKNGKAFGETRAAEIVDEVLAIWAGDISIDRAKRSLIRTMREERRSGPAVENAAGPEIDDLVMIDGEELKAAASHEEEPVSTGEMEALLNELKPEPEAGDSGEALADIQGDSASGSAGEEPGPDLIIEDAAEILAELDAEVSVNAGGGRTGQAPDEDSFLIEDLIQTEGGREKGDTGGRSDESYLIGNDSIMEVPEVEPAIKEAPSPGDNGAVDSIEIFTIKDEVLFQDNPEKRRKTMRERSRKGMRITKIDLSGPDEA
jgi:hypothetical protein